MSRTPVAVFARPPRPGVAKTRLVPALGERGAATLYAAFLADVLARCASVPGLGTRVYCADDPEAPELVEVTGDLPRVAQRGDDLGARMARALGELVGSAGRGLIVGSDVPTLPAAHLSAAADALVAGAELVLGPSADGGYCLVGVSGAVPPVFDGVRWSGPHVLADTLARAREAGLRVRLLPPWYDVDTPADLRLLRAHLALAPGAAPRTAQCLANGAQSS